MLPTYLFQYLRLELVRSGTLFPPNAPSQCPLRSCRSSCYTAPVRRISSPQLCFQNPSTRGWTIHGVSHSFRDLARVFNGLQKFKRELIFRISFSTAASLPYLQTPCAPFPVRGVGYLRLDRIYYGSNGPFHDVVNVHFEFLPVYGFESERPQTPGWSY